MAVPLATTTITISRIPPDATRDGYDTPPSPTTVASGVRAHLSGPGKSTDPTGGLRVATIWRLDADPCDLRAGDTVVDDSTGSTFTAMNADTRYGLGLDHTVASLERVDGAR